MAVEAVHTVQLLAALGHTALMRLPGIICRGAVNGVAETQGAMVEVSLSQAGDAQTSIKWITGSSKASSMYP